MDPAEIEDTSDERETLLQSAQLDGPLAPSTTDLTKDKRTLVVCTLLLLLFLFGGAALFSVVEGWDFEDGLYFCVVLLTTVGYGDVAPATDAGKVLSCVLSMFGIALIGSAVGIVVSAMSDALDRVTDDPDDWQALLPAQTGFLASWRASFRTKTGPSRAEKIISMRRRSFVLSLLYWLLMVFTSAIVFSYTETTSTETMSFGDAFYMSVMTATTIGFGDIHPHTPTGRGIAIVWILVSTFVTANVLRNISAVFIEYRALRIEDKMLQAKWSHHDLAAFDLTGDGQVNELEFMVGMLLRTGRVDAALIKDIRGQFRRKDKTGSKTITMRDLRLASSD